MSDGPSQRLSSEWAFKNVSAMRAGLDKHNGSCEHAAEAFLLNPIDHGLLRLDELWGIPVRPDESVATKRFRVHCARPAPDEEGELPDEEPPV